MFVRRVQRSSGNFQGLECSQHLTLKFLVMDVERMNVLGRTTALGPKDSGQDRFDHLRAQDGNATSVRIRGRRTRFCRVLSIRSRQVIDQPLNDFLQPPVPCFSLAGTLFATEDGFESGHVQQSACAVNEPLINFVQVPAAFKQKIAAVFQLVAGIGVAKARTSLLFVVEHKTQAGRIDPAIYHSRQTREAPAPSNCWASRLRPARSEPLTKQLPSLTEEIACFWA